MKAEYGISKEVALNDWRKINLILDAKEGESVKELLTRAANEGDEWFKQRYGIPASDNQSFKPSGEGIIPQPIQDIQVGKVEDALNGTQQAIIGSEDVSALLEFRLLVKQFPSLQPAYDKRMKELQGE